MITMDIKEIRLANLLLLAEKYGSMAELARQTGLNRFYLYQLRSPVTKASMGDDVARRIEAKLSLEHGWMDNLHLEEEKQQAIAFFEDFIKRQDAARVQQIIDFLKTSEALITATRGEGERLEPKRRRRTKPRR